MLTHVLEPIKKKTDDRVEKLKEQINNIYKKLNRKETSDIQLKKALKGYMRSYRIIGNDKVGYKTFPNNKKDSVFDFIKSINQ